MVIVEKISAVAELLLKAAKAGDVLMFKDFHAVFDIGTKDEDKYDTLEAASRALAPTGVAIYSAVLAKKDTNCPGSGFYDIFNNVHRNEFFEVTGHNDIHELTDEDRRNIAAIERPRVYEHAHKHFILAEELRNR